jgi:hypothetical protein
VPKASAPHYELWVVRTASTIRVRRGKASLAVRDRAYALRKPMTDSEAEEYVRDMVRGLTPDAFVETLEMTWLERQPVRADIYGVRDAMGDWYLKLYLWDVGVVVASCHPPLFPLTRADGLRLGRRR